MVLKEVLCHQGCIYLIKNTVQTTIFLPFKIGVIKAELSAAFNTCNSSLLN